MAWNNCPLYSNLELTQSCVSDPELRPGKTECVALGSTVINAHTGFKADLLTPEWGNRLKKNVPNLIGLSNLWGKTFLSHGGKLGRLDRQINRQTKSQVLGKAIFLYLNITQCNKTTPTSKRGSNRKTPLSRHSPIRHYYIPGTWVVTGQRLLLWSSTSRKEEESGFHRGAHNTDCS